MFSPARPWAKGYRADTVLAERRLREVKPSDRFVKRIFARLQKTRARPTIAQWIETRLVLLEAARWRSQPDDALVAALNMRAKKLLQSGMRGAAFRQSAAIVREMTDRTLGLRLHGVQVMGGLALARGNVIEMGTGEGKTLTTLIPAIIVASMRFPVHVVTVNGYLAARDWQTLKPVLDAFALTSASVTEETEPPDRPKAHDHDVVFTTNTDLTFDYLRDRVAHGKTRSALSSLARDRLENRLDRQPRNLVRGLGFAILDEIDSVLIDEAQTPLIITAERAGGEDTQSTETMMLGLAKTLDEGTHFTLHRKERRVELLPQADPVLADLQSGSQHLQSDLARRDMLTHALSAVHLFHRDDHYVITDEGVAIIDEFTGRLMPDRQWQQGLHQMIEAKENVDRSADRETLAQITYQTMFNRFLWFSGMSGTVREVSAELRASFDRALICVPPNKRKKLRYRGVRLYRRDADRWRAVVRYVAKCAAQDVPVLVGTRSVAASEHVSRLLTEAGLTHDVLNANQDAQEAEIVARAGQAGRITVATNMAGRGTDIPVSADIAQRGGLHVVLTEFHNSVRIDRQLLGRTARQGQRGSAIALVSLEDGLFTDTVPVLSKAVRTLGLGLAPRLPGALADLLRNIGQNRAEKLGRKQRRKTVQQAERLKKSYGYRQDYI